ncbi:MAG: hypothetical protein RR840_04850 [Clostridium sp.]
MSVKGYGTFYKVNGDVVRTDTYIQFGDSSDIIGSFVMCNPGSSKNEDVNIQRLKEGEVLQGELSIDPTMDKLINIVNMVYGNPNGRVNIYNLFINRNPDMDSASSYLRDNYESELVTTDFNKFKNDIDRIPWVVLSWGCKKNTLVDKLKKIWLKYLDNIEGLKCGVLSTSKDNKEQIHYYHIKPKIGNGLEIAATIAEQIKEIIN